MDQIKDFEKIIFEKELSRRADIYRDSIKPVPSFRSIILNLATARTSQNPYQINFPFDHCYVQASSTTTANINVKLSTTDTYQDPIPMKLDNEINLDSPVSGAFLDWTAQTSATITLVFSMGVQFVGNSPSVTLSNAIWQSATMTQFNFQPINSTTVRICTRKTNRFLAQVFNGDGNDIQVGDSTIGVGGSAKQGYVIASYQPATSTSGISSYEHYGQAELWMIASATGSVGSITVLEYLT